MQSFLREIILSGLFFVLTETESTRILSLITGSGKDKRCNPPSITPDLLLQEFYKNGVYSNLSSPLQDDRILASLPVYLDCTDLSHRLSASFTNMKNKKMNTLSILVFIHSSSCVQWMEGFLLDTTDGPIKYAGQLLTMFDILTIGGDNYECSYRDVVKRLNLSKKSDLVTKVQPIKNSSSATQLSLDVMLYAILNVNEKDQLFVSYLWVDMIWKDDYISWKPTNSCDIKMAYIPTKTLWTPDITIEEMTEQDKTPQNPYLTIRSDGTILQRIDMVVVSTCNMQIYKFPFDTQRCNLTFKSAIHDDKHLKLKQPSTAERITEWSNEMMQSQSEWEFISMTFCNKTRNNFDVNQSMIVYTISMKRRSVLYIVNFLLPVLLFLSLDLASFMISEHGGEKLSFKVTVLLAVTVMQLLLNEILPSSSDRIPLIAMYCIGIFGLMMLSLLETIFVMFLLEKDFAARYKLDENKRLCQDCEDKRCKAKTCGCFGDVELVCCGSASNMSSGGTSSELLHVAKEASSNNLMKASQDSGKDLLKDLAFLLSGWKARERPGSWSKVARTINRVFFIFYLITVSLFLSYMFYSWNVEDNM